MPSEEDQKYALDINVPCFIHFNGQHYRFDDIAKNYGVITDKEEFDKYVPLRIIKKHARVSYNFQTVISK